MRSLSPSHEPLMADALTQLPYKNRFSKWEIIPSIYLANSDSVWTR